MSYAIFKQGIVTKNNFKPGKIIVGGLETKDEAYQVLYDLAVDGVYSAGYTWDELAYDDFANSMQVVRMA